MPLGTQPKMKVPRGRQPLAQGSKSGIPPESEALVLFEKPARPRTPGMDGAQARPSGVVLPQKRTKPVKPPQSFMEQPLPPRRQRSAGGKIRQPPGDLATPAAMMAVAPRILFGSFRPQARSLGDLPGSPLAKQSVPLSPHLDEKFGSLPRDPGGLALFQPHGQRAPSRFLFQQKQVAHEEFQGKPRIGHGPSHKISRACGRPAAKPDDERAQRRHLRKRAASSGWLISASEGRT